MLGVLRKLWIALPILFALPILIIHAQPYDDRATRALITGDCRQPCLMGIRPGTTIMEGAVYTLQAHDWVANQADEFPAPVRYALLYGIPLPRTLIHWRWSATQPGWIDGAQNGTLIVEDNDVWELTVDTHLSLGEILLAFGDPDEARFMTTGTQAGRQFEYTAWYASERMLIRSEGRCPRWHYYDLPVQIHLRLESPNLSETIPRTSVC